MPVPKVFRPTCSVDGCAAQSVHIGYCSAHYYRMRRTGLPDLQPRALIPRRKAQLCGCGCGAFAPVTRNIPKRYIFGHQLRGRSKPNPYTIDSNGCHVWNHCLNEWGYGETNVNGVQTRAHVAAYVAKYGPVPDGMILDHLCRVRKCVNPDHLEPVTHAVNTQRGLNAKLCPESVVEIRKLYAAGGITQRALGHKFGVTGSVISDAVNRVSWFNIA